MKRLLIIGILLVGIYVFVLPIPHAITIRDVLLLCLLGVFGYSAYRTRPSSTWLRELRLPLSLYLILTLWLFIVALVISHETAWSLGEIRGQWLKGAAALAAGMLVALSLQTEERTARLIFLAIFLALLAHILYLDFMALTALIESGTVPRRIGGLTAGPDLLNYLANILFALLLAEIFLRFNRNSGYLPLRRVLVVSALVLALFSTYVTQVRNGIIPLVFMGIVFVVLYFRKYRLRISKPVLVAITTLIVSSIILVAYISTTNTIPMKTRGMIPFLTWVT